jgi:hypothetical protein
LALIALTALTLLKVLTLFLIVLENILKYLSMKKTQMKNDVNITNIVIPNNNVYDKAS